ncbi:MAG TPA: tail fiber domain-containing protein, partial [Verrucomicrobiae bacterium]|nr:tail fiber domain-containing protein [Verrucomicrobiae bacterium]
NYKTDPVDEKHLGPMAQDFHAAFGLNGSDDKHISTVDEGGVALAAIQGLNQKLEAESQAKDAEIQQLRQTVAQLKNLVNQLIAQKEGNSHENQR